MTLNVVVKPDPSSIVTKDLGPEFHVLIYMLRVVFTMCCPCICKPSQKSILSRTESGRHTEVKIWLPQKVF